MPELQVCTTISIKHCLIPFPLKFLLSHIPFSFFFVLIDFLNFFFVVLFTIPHFHILVEVPVSSQQIDLFKVFKMVLDSNSTFESYSVCQLHVIHSTNSALFLLCAQYLQGYTTNSVQGLFFLISNINNWQQFVISFFFPVG